MSVRDCLPPIVFSLSAAGATGCGPTPPAASADPVEIVAPIVAPAAATTSATSAPAATPALDTAAQKREAAAAYAVAALGEPQHDPREAGRLTFFELSEKEYDLPRGFRGSLVGLGAPSADESENVRLMEKTLSEEPMAGALEKACGKRGEALVDLVKKGTKVKELLAMCNEGDEALNGRRADKVHPLSLLISIVALELMEARGGRTPSEEKLARFAVQYDPSWHR